MNYINVVIGSESGNMYWDKKIFSSYKEAAADMREEKELDIEEGYMLNHETLCFEDISKWQEIINNRPQNLEDPFISLENGREIRCLCCGQELISQRGFDSDDILFRCRRCGWHNYLRDINVGEAKKDECESLRVVIYKSGNEGYKWNGVYYNSFDEATEEAIRIENEIGMETTIQLLSVNSKEEWEDIYDGRQKSLVEYNRPVGDNSDYYCNICGNRLNEHKDFIKDKNFVTCNRCHGHTEMYKVPE